MKPIKAWAIVNSRAMQGNVDGQLLVYWIRYEAAADLVEREDRIVRVEIREVVKPERFPMATARGKAEAQKDRHRKVTR